MYYIFAYYLMYILSYIIITKCILYLFMTCFFYYYFFCKYHCYCFSNALVFMLIFFINNVIICIVDLLKILTL